jgi:hypothetical protein
MLLYVKSFQLVYHSSKNIDCKKIQHLRRPKAVRKILKKTSRKRVFAAVYLPPGNRLLQTVAAVFCGRNATGNLQQVFVAAILMTPKICSRVLRRLY